ncbi:MAG: CDP-alcohol phosphatidyltransferase family protein [Bacteroidota bacterium]
MSRKFYLSLSPADWVSLFRIFSFPIVLILIYYQLRLTYSILISLNLISDLLDGIIARKLKCQSAKGAMLDSIGDLLNVILMIAGVYFFEQKFFIENFIYLSISIFLFLSVIAYGFFKYGKPASFHTWLSKFSAVFLGIFFMVLFFIGPFECFFYLTIFFTVLSQIEELILIYLIPFWRTDVKGIFWLMKDAF